MYCVVLNGAGGLSVRVRRETLSTIAVAAPRSVSNAFSACLLVPDAFGLVALFVAIEVLGLERLVVLLQVGEQFPVVLGVERLNLAFACPR